jgi:hypothetical protein
VKVRALGKLDAKNVAKLGMRASHSCMRITIKTRRFVTGKDQPTRRFSANSFAAICDDFVAQLLLPHSPNEVGA